MQFAVKSPLFINLLFGLFMYATIFKKIITALIDQPFLASLFIADFGILLFLSRLDFIFSLLMLVALMTVCMYFGQKLALFKD
jgi:hypothetical protein